MGTINPDKIETKVTDRIPIEKKGCRINKTTFNIIVKTKGMNILESTKALFETGNTPYTFATLVSFSSTKTILQIIQNV